MLATACNEQVRLRGDLRYHEPLADYTSWRVGGPAKRYYRPADSADLRAFLSTLEPDEPLLWLGLGSNLLVADEGFVGTVIHTLGALDAVEMCGERRLRVESGVTCAKLARFSARRSLTGIEFLAGIPGTFGGALAMNAGAYGGEVWAWVEQVETIDHTGTIRQRTADDFDIGYRRVGRPDGEWFFAAELELCEGDAEVSLGLIRELLDRRGRSQPIGLASCGSVFRNPPGDHAGRLIDTAGLKGFRIGDAQVSEKHANFIINTGRARATDIVELIDRVRVEVERCHGVRLIPEVHCVGGRR